MYHASGSKGSQPHNIQVCRLVLKSLQMKGCVKHQKMQMLVKLPLVSRSETLFLNARRRRAKKTFSDPF